MIYNGQFSDFYLTISFFMELYMGKSSNFCVATVERDN